MRRKHIEATKDLKEDFKRRRELLVGSGGVLDTEGLERDVQELSIVKTTRGLWFTSGSPTCDTMPSRTWRKFAEVVDKKMKTCYIARGKVLVPFGTKCLFREDVEDSKELMGERP